MRARRLGLVAVATLTFGTLVACGASEEVTDSTAATTDGGTVTAQAHGGFFSVDHDRVVIAATSARLGDAAAA